MSVLETATPAVTINGVPFTPKPGITYKNNYVLQASHRDHPERWSGLFGSSEGLTPQTVEYAVYRHLILTDLWFILYFVLGVPENIANTPFGVKICRMVEDGPPTMTLDIWSRGHLKTSVISIAETLQYHLKFPELCTIIFSYKKGLAEKIERSIKRAYEMEFLTTLFPDVLYQNPEQESPLWALQNGLIVKRKNKTRGEPTIYASGLVEGMAQGFHSERLVFDDFETEDMADSPEVLAAVFSKFEMAQFLHTKTTHDVQRVIGTIYSHDGPIIKIKNMKTNDGVTPLYQTRIIPGTVDGAFDGVPVLWSQATLDIEKTKPHYAMQVLCDPTPKALRRLRSDALIEIDPGMIPKHAYKFMVVDPAGERKNNKGDAWAILMLAVDPNVEEVGAMNLYIVNALITPLGESEAIEEIVRMYLAGGIVQKLGVEKVALSTTEIHIRRELQNRGRRISIDEGSLVALRPAGRDKKDRIQKALSWPLNNGKIHVSRAIPVAYRDRLKKEMDQFPYGSSDDGLDALAYGYDMLRDTDFSGFQPIDADIQLPHSYRQPTYVG